MLNLFSIFPQEQLSAESLSIIEQFEAPEYLLYNKFLRKLKSRWKAFGREKMKRKYSYQKLEASTSCITSGQVQLLRRLNDYVWQRCQFYLGTNPDSSRPTLLRPMTK